MIFAIRKLLLSGAFNPGQTLTVPEIPWMIHFQPGISRVLGLTTHLKPSTLAAKTPTLVSLVWTRIHAVSRYCVCDAELVYRILPNSRNVTSIMSSDAGFDSMLADFSRACQSFSVRTLEY